MFLVLDESGHLHTNSKGRFFVIGGFICQKDELIKITRKFKKVNLILKNNKNMDVSKELKSKDLKIKDKHFLLKELEKIKNVMYVFVIIDKEKVEKNTINKVNLFYNYSINILVECLINSKLINKNINVLNIKLDNRSIRLSSHNSLEDYLNIKFNIEKKLINDFSIKCKYYDSKNDYSVQIADLLCNVVWAKFNFPETDKSSLYLEKNSFFVYFPLKEFGS